MYGSWHIIFFSKDGSSENRQNELLVLCENHWLFPHFISSNLCPVPISVHLKYPVPCCLCGFWGQSRCFCVGSWCLWWVILLSIYSSLPQYILTSKVFDPIFWKMAVMTCFGGYVHEKFQSVFLCGSSQSFLSQNISELGVSALLHDNFCAE